MWWRRRRARTDTDFTDEVESHLALEAERLIADGMRPEDARAAARRAFGNVTATHERFYEAGRLMWLDDLRRDLPYALRMLRRTPGFAAVAVLTLALGIGANTAIFSVVHAVLLRPLPYADADRLVRIVDHQPPSAPASGPPARLPGLGVFELIALRARTQTLSHVGVYAGTTMTLTGRGETVRLDGLRVSPDVLSMLGTRPLIGRTFAQDEERPGADGRVILSHATWQRHFRGDAAIVGQTITLDARDYAVIGVMPPGFQFPDAQTTFWVPFVLPTGGPAVLSRFAPLARLADGVTMGSAIAEIATILQPTATSRSIPPPPPPPPAQGLPRPARANAGPSAPSSLPRTALPRSLVPPAPPPPTPRGEAPRRDGGAPPPPPPPMSASPSAPRAGLGVPGPGPPPPPAAASARPAARPGSGPSAQRQEMRSGRASTGPAPFALVRIQDELVAPVRPALFVLTGAVGFVLLIACVNVAGLLLARTAARQREIGVRLALGAGRGRLVRQALAESILLALIGGAAGSGLAFGGLQLLRTFGASLPRRDLGPGVRFPRLDEIGLDASVWAFTFAIAVVTGVLFGLGPALGQARPDPVARLREGSGGSGVSGFTLFGRHRAGLLIVAEIAMAMMLLVGGALLIRSVVALVNVDAGYDPRHVLTFQVAGPPAARSDEGRRQTFAEELVARLRALPGVQSAGYAQSLPMIGYSGVVSLRTAPDSPSLVPPPPAPFGSRARPEFPSVRRVSRDFLTVMGVRLIAGRGFADEDRAGQPRALLVNQTLARSGLLGPHPVGARVYMTDAEPWEVVGIVDDVRQVGLELEADPQVFLDMRQSPTPSGSEYFAIRTHAAPAALASSVRAIVHDLDPRATVDHVATMEQLVANSISRRRLYAVLLGVFAAVAVALAAMGIYGVMAYAVAQRTREIGIRIALGAARSSVLGLMLRQSLMVTGAGIALGLIGAAAVTRSLEGWLFGLTPHDPTTFIVVAVAFAAIATLAAWVPARRATTIDPLIALRSE